MRECPFRDACLLWQGRNTPNIPYTGSRHPEVLFVGESPGQEEDEQGANFVGRAGRFLRAAQSEIGFVPEQIAFTSIVKCRTVDFKGNDRPPKDAEVNKCKGHVLAEIETLKPKVVVLLGASALFGVLGEKGITANRGRVFKGNGITYLPTWHPAAVLRDPSKERQFVDDLVIAFREWRGEDTQGQKASVNYILVDTMDKFRLLVQKATVADELAFDVETHPALSPFTKDSQIISLGLSFQEREAFVIPWYHSIPLLTSDQVRYTKAFAKELLEDNVIRKYAHNGKFDMLWLEVKESIEVANFDFDTILAQYLLTQERGTLGLDYLAWTYTDMGGYDEPLAQYKSLHKECNPQLGGSYANVPWNILFPYAAGDPDCTIRCVPILNALLEKGTKP